MAARVQSVAFQGIDVVPVDVQVTIASGLPNFFVVGLPPLCAPVSLGAIS
jgi:magnesium chelatase family protein